MTDTGGRLTWIEPPEPTESACPLCQNADGNHVFLSAGTMINTAEVGQATPVARCGSCASAWFPDLVLDESYPDADPTGITDGFLALIDHYVELCNGLDWKVSFLGQLPHHNGIRVMEVGCNVGVLLDYCHRVWGAEVVGLEPSLYGLAGARRLDLPIRNQYMSDYLVGLENDDDRFDLVVSTEVIEHVADPVTFLSEVRSMLRPEGMALITTPNANGLTPDQTAGGLYASLSVGAHRFVASPQQLTSIARAAGFASVDVQEYPMTLVAILSAEPLELAPLDDHRTRCLAYHEARIEHGVGTPRHRLADRIARYVLSRELDIPTDDDGPIDAALHDQFDLDIRDLSSLVERATEVTDIFEFQRLGPFTLASYLLWRGHRDDLSDQERTEMWEATVFLVGRAMAIDPVNLFVIEQALDRAIMALDGRPSGRWHASAQAALAAASELSDRSLPFVAPPPPTVKQRVRRLMRRFRRPR